MKISDINLEFVHTQSWDTDPILFLNLRGSCEMCVETMDTKPTKLSTNCLRKHKFVSKIKWKMLRVRTTEDTFKMLHKTVHKGAVSRCTRQKPKKSSLTKFGKGLRNFSDNEGKNRSAAMAHTDVVLTHRLSGSMAPENTTQYLMANIYADMSQQLCEPLTQRVAYDAPVDVYGESLSPAGVSTALDSIYDDYLAFQQRDFEEVFGL